MERSCWGHTKLPTEYLESPPPLQSPLPPPSGTSLSNAASGEPGLGGTHQAGPGRLLTCRHHCGETWRGKSEGGMGDINRTCTASAREGVVPRMTDSSRRKTSSRAVAFTPGFHGSLRNRRSCRKTQEQGQCPNLASQESPAPPVHGHAKSAFWRCSGVNLKYNMSGKVYFQQPSSQTEAGLDWGKSREVNCGGKWRPGAAAGAGEASRWTGCLQNLQ